MADEALVARLVARLRQTAKYRSLCDDVLRWAAQDALTRATSEKDAAKVAKRKLHQAFGSFVDARQRKTILGHLQAAAEADDERAFCDALRGALEAHASTAERVSTLEAVWAAVRDHAGPIRSVLDLGCGVHPATLPWSGLPHDVRYLGIDLDDELCAGLTRALAGRYPHAAVVAADVRALPPPEPVDVVLMFKLLPTLERQASGAARALVDKLRASTLVASFPTRSLTGRDVGMASRYASLAQATLGPGVHLQVGDELLYVAGGPDQK